MSFYGLASGTNFNTLFGNSSYGKSSSSTNLNFLSDYASIKNGSYYKLTKAYYGGNSKLEALGSHISTAKDSAKKLTAVQCASDELKEAADALYKHGSKSVFKLVEQEKEDGTKEKGYDVDAIYDKVNQFVKAYNDVMDATDDVESEALGKVVKNLTGSTRANDVMLERIGITMGKDGSLKLDEETFRNSDMNMVKNMFNGTGSYGYQISMRASMLDYTAEREATKANTYNRQGQYSYNFNYSYNSYI